jgi:hypothetical protein
MRAPPSKLLRTPSLFWSFRHSALALNGHRSITTTFRVDVATSPSWTIFAGESFPDALGASAIVGQSIGEETT